jgi:ubiquitin-activating enzyme E1
MDASRYSRQSYSIGQDLMCKLSNASVLIIGYSTLTLELIKNLALLGTSNISIQPSKTKLTRYQQTGMYYSYDYGIPLVELRKLNPTIQINQVNILSEINEFIVEEIAKYNVVILTNSIFDDAVNLDRICLKLNIPFIMTGSYGLMGYVFNDFGETFTINDVDGEIYENLLIDSIDSAKKLIKFKDPHNLSDGDILIAKIKQQNSDYIVELKVKETKTPFIIEMKDEIKEADPSKYIQICKKKIPQQIKFNSLKNNYLDARKITNICADSSVPFTRSNDLHELHLAYNKYIEKYSDTPRAWSCTDFELFKDFITLWDAKTEEFKILAKKFCFTLRGDVLPICSIIAAICSQEVLKVLGKKYIPITQWYYMDYYDLISDNEIIGFKESNSKKFRTASKYEGLVNVFGKDLLEKIQNTRPFVIGSGAIGCELIKHLGMFGVSQIVLTDMDNIEKSNLSRQFLFADSDIHKSKALTAANKIKQMNLDTNVQTYELKVCKESENIFTEKFHNQIDVYLNALDNVDARLYVDNLAIKYTKPLIDSGTMGSKGNVQVIIPHLTESYGSTKDPDDSVNAGIPICTIKSFPYKQAHTIQWARELFETEFNEIPNKINKIDIRHLDKLNTSEINTMVKQLTKYKDFELNTICFQNILANIYYENYVNSIAELKAKYSDPERAAEIDGKKMPEEIDFKENDDVITDFMKWGFTILNQMFNTKVIFNENSHYNLLNVSDKINIQEEFAIPFLSEIINNLTKYKISSVEFDKDNDDLGHISWITNASNLRNIQYTIEKADIYDTRKIAGNIIPAMITTTALISGYQIMEYIKIIKYYNKNAKSGENIWKNRFVNLNINYIDGIEPIIASSKKIGSLYLTLWDKVLVQTNFTEKIIEQINKMTTKKVEYMMQGNEIVYDGDDIFKKVIDFTKDNLLALIEDNIELLIYYSK